MVRTIVSGVVHEIRSAADRGVTLTCLQPTFGTEDEPGVSVPKNGGDERTSGADMRRIHKNDGHSTSSRSRSASPGKRKSLAQDGYDDGFPSYEDGLSPEDGLSVLLRACEILGNSSNDQNTRQENTVHSGARDADSSPRKQVKSPAQSPQKASRNASPTRSRHEKPHGPCTNKHCLNPNESPQWRRGPPEAPILCNACGTRWLRSKQLIPIMPQRGIRYGKSGGRSPKKAPASPVKREGPVLDGTETQRPVQPDDKSITKSSEGNKSPVVKIIASI